MSHKYTAIIVETRKHKALEFTLNNMVECLSDKWKIVLFHGTNNAEYALNIANKLNKLFDNRIHIVKLDSDNLNQKTYSKLLATKSVIYNYIDTEYFLVFQTDSVMIQTNIFLDKNYDYVGAPWLICGYEPTRQRDFIGNGGFSLRKTATMLRIIENNQWDENKEWHEDLFLQRNMKVSKP